MFSASFFVSGIKSSASAATFSTDTSKDSLMKYDTAILSNQLQITTSDLSENYTFVNLVVPDIVYASPTDTTEFKFSFFTTAYYYIRLYFISTTWEE